MLLPLAWLKTYLKTLPKLEKLSEILMMHGLEVEAVIDRSQDFRNVVVGEVMEVKPHPNADKLQLASVVTKANGKPQEIVCGAPNISTGQKVAVALLGATLPNGITIEKRKIRGVESNGMVCAEDELGLGKHHEGILVLDSSLKVGTPLTKALSLDQPVLDLAIPANRSDLMSVRGLAWEIGAMLGKKPAFPKVAFNEGSETIRAQVQVDDPKLCPLYTARVIRGVTIAQSPLWMQSWLWAAGMRPINAVVDVTNYVMLNYGQPLHAFDAAKVADESITVRVAQSGETLVTLDGETRQLDPSMLMIADNNGPIALAGVKGGLNSGVADTTIDIILESAIFNPVSIRKTSRKLGLVSEASKRYEKGLWPELAEEASRVAAALIAEFCGGTVEQGSVAVGETKSKPASISMDPKYMSERLGMKIAPAKSKTILTKLGFAVSGSKTWKVIVPEWRLDVSLPEDIVDEVGRMIGYEDVPEDMPVGDSGKDLPDSIRFREEVKNILVDLGFTEIMSHAFYGDDNAGMISGKHFEVANPLDETQHKLRKSVIPQIQQVLAREANAGHDAQIFEIGHVFDPGKSGSVDQQQVWELVLGVTQKSDGRLHELQQAFQDRLHTRISAEVRSPKDRVRGRVLEMCAFDLKTLMAASAKDFGPWDPDRHVAHGAAYKEISKYPAVTRDISFWWSGDEDQLKTLIADFQKQSPLLREATTKDQFTKDGKSSYLIAFVYQSPERTLTKAEVDKLEQQIKDALMKLGATIR